MTEASGGATPAGYGLLDGVVVVEVAHELTEYAGTMLAGLGASVWLVEPPGGSPTRSRRPYAPAVVGSRRSIPFVARNAGKRSVVIDPTDATARRSWEHLLGAADVVIEHESSPFGAAAGPSRPPRVRISDRRHIGVSPIVVFAASGSLSSSGWPHQPPCNAPSWLGLDAVGTFAALAAVLLVRERRVSGVVRDCEIPLMEAAIAGLTNWTRTLYSYGTSSAGQGAETKRTGSGPFPVFPCADGSVRVIATVQHQWDGFVELLGRPEVLLDPMWSSFQFRSDNHDAIFAVASELLRDRTMAELFHQGQALHVPITPAFDLLHVLDDPHVRARDAFVPVADPDLGDIRQLRPPLRTGDPADRRDLTPAPGLGEHQAELAGLAALAGPEAAGSPIAAPLRSAPPAAQPDDPRPLTGIRVLSFGVGAVIPEATSLLALLGAEVIKVESAYGLDFFRALGGDATGDVNQSPTFNQANLGVKSCCINAATEDGRAVLAALVARCDIVMENMRGPVMRKFGMDYARVAAIKPDIIYMSAQGLGPGPYESYVTYGPNLQSFAGMTSIWAHPDDPYPVGSTLAFPDNQAGKLGLAAVLAALVRRDATGQGCYLDCAQFEACLWAIADKFLQHQVLPGSVGVMGNRSPDHAPHGCYPCAGDDQWCAIAADDDEAWAALVDVLGDDGLRDRALASLDGRLAQATEIDAAIGAWTARRSPAEAVAALRAAGVTASIIVDGFSQAHDRDMHQSGFYVNTAHPRAGVRQHTGLPLIFDGRRVPVRRAPVIGEHTEYVLLDLLGMDPVEVSRLVESGAVGT